MANENVVIDLLGTPHTNGVVSCAYNQTTNEITCTYADDTTQTLVLNDKHVADVTLSGTDFIITMDTGTVFTTSLASLENPLDVDYQADWIEIDTGAKSYIRNKPLTESNLSSLINGNSAVISNDNGTGFTINEADTNNAGVMTSSDFDKLALLNTSAEQNVQSDWTESNTSLDSYIQNKENIEYTAPIPDSTNSSAGLATAAQITAIETNTIHSASSHAPIGAEVNVQSDWTETVGTEDSFIANKPANLVIATSYTPGTDTLAVTYEDAHVDNYVLNDVYVSNVSLSGTDFIITLNNGTVFTTSLDTFTDIHVASGVYVQGTGDLTLTHNDSSTVLIDLSAITTYIDTEVAAHLITKTDTYATSEGQTSFSIAYDIDTVDVYVEGILIHPTEYAHTTGTEIVFNVGVSDGSWVRVTSFL